jgi:nucleoside-diphosphate-sugar epimerase
MGPHIVRQLAALGHEVTVLHRGQSDTVLPDGVRRLMGDRDALASLSPELDRVAPEVVIDVIPYTERHARILVQTFRGKAGRVIALSSGDVYRNYDGLRGRSVGSPDPTPLGEGAPLREELYPYRGYDALPFEHKDDYEKILVEGVVLGDPQLPGTVLRLPAVYGPGDRQHRIAPYLERMDKGERAILLEVGQAEWRWTRGYVENVAAAVVRAATDERAAGRIFNVGEEPAPTEREWVQRIAEAAGWSGEIAVVAAEETSAGPEQPFDWKYALVFDTQRIRDELGYAEPVSCADAMERTVRWERAQRRRNDAGMPGRPGA